MSGINEVKRAIDDYYKQILATVESRCRKFCSDMCIEAVKNRKTEPGAHNFTGNLLNSIVVCLYRDSKPRDAWYSSMVDGVTKAIRIKMRVRPHKKRYYFPTDYDGASGTKYSPPDIPISGRWGVDDAKDFFSSYKPSGDHLFDIVVAYTVEYADWIEQVRNTTGILRTKAFAERTGITYLKLVRK